MTVDASRSNAASSSAWGSRIVLLTVVATSLKLPSAVTRRWVSAPRTLVVLAVLSSSEPSCPATGATLAPRPPRLSIVAARSPFCAAIPPMRVFSCPTRRCNSAPRPPSASAVACTLVARSSGLMAATSAPARPASSSTLGSVLVAVISAPLRRGAARAPGPPSGNASSMKGSPSSDVRRTVALEPTGMGWPVADRHRDLRPVAVEDRLGDAADHDVGDLHGVARPEVADVVEAGGEGQVAGRRAEHVERAARGQEPQHHEEREAHDDRPTVQHGDGIRMQGVRLPRPSLARMRPMVASRMPLTDGPRLAPRRTVLLTGS